MRGGYTLRRHEEMVAYASRKTNLPATCQQARPRVSHGSVRTSCRMRVARGPLACATHTAHTKHSETSTSTSTRMQWRLVLAACAIQSWRSFACLVL